MTAPPTTLPRATRRSARVERRRQTGANAIALVGALAAAVGAAFAPGQPTGHGVVDVALRMALAFAVTIAGARASNTALLAALAAAMLGSTQDRTLFFVALALFVLGIVAITTNAANMATRVLLTGAVVQVLLRLPLDSPTNLSAVVAGAVMVGLLVSGHRRGTRAGRRLDAWILVVLGTLATAATLLYLATALVAASHVNGGVDAARAGIDAARNGDTDLALEHFERARRSLADANDLLGLPFTAPARAVPLVAQHEHAIRTMVSDAERLVAAGSTAARDADVDSLRMEQGRLDPAKVVEMAAPLRRVQRALTRVDHHLEGIDTPWLLPPLDHALDDLTQDVGEARRAVATARVGVRAAPELLGADRPRNYFLAFTTPTEARAAGGFMGNWGVLTVSDGRLALSEFGRSEDLNKAGNPAAKTLSGPPDYLRRYGRFSPATEWRNVNMSPDFPTVTNVIREMFPQSGGRAIDGVLAIDPKGIAALLELTGPVNVAGRTEPLTAKNAAKFLLRDQYVEFEASNPDRIDYLSDAAKAVTNRLTTSSLPGLHDVGRILGRAARGGHLQARSFDPDADRFLRRLDIAQTLGGTPGDYLGLVTQNASGSKLELFLHRTMRIDTTVDPSTGQVRSTVEVRLRNDAPTSGLPDYVIGNFFGLPRGTSRLFLSLYTPLRASTVTLDGQAVETERDSELGLNVYSKYVDIPPGGEVVLRFQLAGGTHFVTRHGTSAYRLDLLHQTQVNADRVDVRVRTREPWTLGDGRGVTVEDGEARAKTRLTRSTTFTVGVQD